MNSALREVLPYYFSAKEGAGMIWHDTEKVVPLVSTWCPPSRVLNVEGEKASFPEAYLLQSNNNIC